MPNCYSVYNKNPKLLEFLVFLVFGFLQCQIQVLQCHFPYKATMVSLSHSFLECKIYLRCTCKIKKKKKIKLLYESSQYILWQMHSLKSYFKSVEEVKPGLQMTQSEESSWECFLGYLAIQN